MLVTPLPPGVFPPLLGIAIPLAGLALELLSFALVALAVLNLSDDSFGEVVEFGERPLYFAPGIAVIANFYLSHGFRVAC
jgi:hypothetical protein